MEQVLVVPMEYLQRHGFENESGLLTRQPLYWMDVLLSGHLFMEREAAEKNASYKQIIPYVLVQWRDYYLQMRRLKGQTEARLHDKLSLGLGGHINPGESGRGEDIVLQGLYRELDEEIALHYSQAPMFLGFINDPLSPVGQVHLGAAFVLDVSDDWFEVREPEKMEGKWVSKQEIEMNFQRFESWSQLVYDYMNNKKI